MPKAKIDFSRLLGHGGALGLYLLLALAFTYPALDHFSTRIIGVEGEMGDSGAILWIFWFFRHALTELHATPLWTDHMYWPYGGNLIIHPNTLVSNLQAFLLMPRIGTAATYNLMMLFSLTLSGWGLYGLARDWGASRGAALVAGALFAFCPTAAFTMDTSTFDYLNLYTLPLFLWTLSRAARDGRLKDAVLAALALSLVWTYSYYYFLFCCLLIPFFYVCLRRPLRLEVEPRAPRRALSAALRLSELLVLLAGLSVALSLSHGQRQFHGRGSFSELGAYVAPYAVFWGFLALRLILPWRLRARPAPSAFSWGALSPYFAVAACWTALNWPMILSVLYFMSSGDHAGAASPWRGGGNPTDPLWLLVPSDKHPLWGEWAQRLRHALPGIPQGIATTGLLPLAAAAWLWRRRPQDAWISLWYSGLAMSLLMTLGPWLKVADVHTYLPLPFYFVHLLPVYSSIQHGLRFIAFVMLFLSLVFAVFLDALKSRAPGRWAAWVCPLAFLLVAVEYLPGRRGTHPLVGSPLYERMAALPDGALLPVPVGAIFNGLSAEGAMGEMFLDVSTQIQHHKPMVGGFLGRISRRTYDGMRQDFFLQSLVAAQKGDKPAWILRDRTMAGKYLRQTHLRYVLVGTSRIPPALDRLISERWPVRLIDQEGPLKLYSVQ